MLGRFARNVTRRRQKFFNKAAFIQWDSAGQR